MDSRVFITNYNHSPHLPSLHIRVLQEQKDRKERKEIEEDGYALECEGIWLRKHTNP